MRPPKDRQLLVKKIIKEKIKNENKAPELPVYSDEEFQKKQRVQTTWVIRLYPPPTPKGSEDFEKFLRNSYKSKGLRKFLINQP